MSKSPDKTKKPASAKDAAGAPKKRSKLTLALLALAPLLLAGGGYGGWMFYFAKPAHGVEAGESGHGDTDAMQVSALPPEVVAENSATHSFALSVLIAEPCGKALEVPALKAASQAEAIASGTVVNLSWLAAARRTVAISEKSCSFMLAEVRQAENRLAAAAADPAAKGAAH